ncbi:MAG: tyrosine-type recombinase/integrase [Hominimerdicola sp.]
MPKAKYQNDGTYYYTYINTGEYLPNGKPKYKKIRGKTISKVDEKVKEYNENKAFQIEPSTITVEQWYNEWFNAYKSDCREKTQAFYKQMYELYIKEKIGNMKVSQVREVHCRQILSDMSDSYSIKTVRSVRSVLYSLFETAKINKIILNNPAEKLQARGKEIKTRRPLTEAERKEYLEACKVHPYGMYAAFLYFFGLRKGECLALTKDDIHENYISVNKQHLFINNNKPKVAPPKTKAGIRDIPIPIKAREYIDFENLPDGLIFKNSKGEAIGFTEHRNKWHSFIHFALGNDTDITEHYIRHNHCCMLIEKKIPLTAIQKIEGHENLDTTLKIYTHHTEEIERESQILLLDIG